MSRAVPRTIHDLPVFPEPWRGSPDDFDDLMHEQARNCRTCGVPVNPLEAATIVAGTNRRVVTTGTFVASCWAGRPRGRAPAVLIVADVEQAASRLLAAWPGAHADSEHPNHPAAGERMIGVWRDEKKLVELWENRGDFLRRVCSTAKPIKSAPRIFAASAEAEFVLSCLGASDKARRMVDRYEFAGGMYGIAENVPDLNVRELIRLGVQWSARTSGTFVDYLAFCRSGEMLRF